MTSSENTCMLGKQIIHLDSVDSTNNYAAKLCKEGSVMHGTVIMADEQTNGRGQRGASWQSNPGMNLTFSLYVEPSKLKADQQTIISHCVSLALIKTLNKKGIAAEIKWPNDIYVKEKKIAGMLIENTLRNGKVGSSIIGIGLNVNQEDFELSATSLRAETGERFIPRDVLESFLVELEKLWPALIGYQIENVLTTVYKHLLGFQQMRKYEDENGVFIGIIEGIDESGHLVMYRNGDLTKYNLKEVSFLF